MTVHKNINMAFSEVEFLPDNSINFTNTQGLTVNLKDGDTLDGGNWSMKQVVEVPFSITAKNRANCKNLRVLGTFTKEGPIFNYMCSHCYWKHINFLPDGTIDNPYGFEEEPENCDHVDPSLVDRYEYTSGEYHYVYDGARDDRPLGWTP